MGSSGTMFMNKGGMDDEDDLDEEDLDGMVVPIALNQESGQVISSGGGRQQHITQSEQGGTVVRSSQYHERMARARTALTHGKRNSASAGMVVSNVNGGTGSAWDGHPAAQIDILSEEVEAMELEEEAKQRTSPERSQDRPDFVEHSTESVSGFSERSSSEGIRHYDPPQHQPVAPQQSSPQSPQRRDNSSPAVPAAPGMPPAPIGAPPPPGPATGGDEPSSSTMRVDRPVAYVPAVIDTSDLRAFLMRPGPQGAMVQCYIQRRKTGIARIFPTYEIYLKDGDQFLLASRKRKKNKASNYLISLDKDDLSRNSGNYFGKLRANFIGTEFMLYDKGANPEKLEQEQKTNSRVQTRQELGTILYKQNVLGARGPRKMKVMVPMVGEDGQRKVLRPEDPSETMLERYKAAKNDQDVVILKNKPPKWNDQVGAYVLNFNGRVTRASVKNFQLCNMARDPDTVVMQFGRVGKDAFTMDYQYPLCALQAFGIALSSFDYKIACE